MTMAILVSLTIVLIFLQDTAILIGTQQLFCAPILAIVTLSLFFIKWPINVMNQTIQLYKKTPTKYLFLFIVFMFVTAFLHTNVTFKIISRFFLIYILIILPITIFSALLVTKVLSYKKILRLFYVMYQFIIYYGICDFICRIAFQKLPPFYYLLCTKGYFSHILGYSLNTSNAIIPRASSIFFEPSFFATFIFLFLPMSYLLYQSNFLIFKNRKYNKIFKQQMIITSWIALFFTKSPIYIVAAIINLVIFFRKKITRFILSHFKYIIFLLTLISSFMLFLLNNNNLYSYELIDNRIINTVTSIGNLNKLIYLEPSLATRIISTYNTIQAGMKSPYFGVGYGNTSDVMYRQYISTKTPLTIEIIEQGIMRDRCSASPNIFWGLFLQTGLIGVLILFTYFVQSLYKANRIKKYLIGSSRLFIDTLILIAINYLIITFYWSIDMYPMIWFIFGLLNSYLFIYKKQFRKLSIKERDNE